MVENEPLTFLYLTLNDFSIFSASGIVDGVHVLSLLAERITLDSEQNITAEPLFLDTVRVKDLYTLGRIQGLVVPRDFALKSIPQKIYGTKHLAHGVSAALIDSRIRANVKGHVGGVDIVDLYRRRVTLSSNQMVSGDFFMGNVSSPMFNAILLNGRPVQEFLGNVMSKSRPQVVEAPKTFTGKSPFCLGFVYIWHTVLIGDTFACLIPFSTFLQA